MKGNRGFIKVIIVIVIALVVLGFFGYNLESIANSPDVKANFSYIWNLLLKLWNTVLVKPVTWLWQNIVINLVWNNLQTILNKGQ